MKEKAKYKGILFRMKKENNGKIILYTSDINIASKFNMKKTGNLSYSLLVSDDEVEFIHIKDIGIYKGEIFYLALLQDGNILLSTRNSKKAEKCGLKNNSGQGKDFDYTLIVSRSEVEELFDNKYFWRELFKIDVKYYEYLSNIEFGKKSKINEKIIEVFKTNNINLSSEATIEKNMKWWIEDGHNQYTISYENNELTVYNGGMI